MEEATHESQVSTFSGICMTVTAAVVMLYLTTLCDVAPGETLASSQYKIIPNIYSNCCLLCLLTLPLLIHRWSARALPLLVVLRVKQGNEQVHWPFVTLNMQLHSSIANEAKRKVINRLTVLKVPGYFCHCCYESFSNDIPWCLIVLRWHL